ncbi:MAG: class I SAM-dependent methyltransferase [Flavobacteriales bacterium]|nr:class I SAM-dependent methyltransferase [Flavobacteriales bacterium]
MLSKEEKSLYRSELFRHLDGIAVAPTGYTLHRGGVMDVLDGNGFQAIDALAQEFQANEGYLNVALRILASQGWIEMRNATTLPEYRLTEKGQRASTHFPLYEGVMQVMEMSEHYHPRKFEPEPFDHWIQVTQPFIEGHGLDPSDEIHAQILKHIEGVLVGPSVVALGMGGMFHKYFMETSFRPEEFHKDPERFGRLLDFFTHLGWFRKKNDTYSFTDKGLFFAKRASAYGVTVSYIPTFRKLPELLFGDPKVLWNVPEGAPEAHVDREMNVWGSGGAHSTYFKKVDEIVIDLFNRPIEEQPKGIVDMGCGNGAYLEHLFTVIDQHTLRGTLLDEHPLFLVGADYNAAALKVTRANLIAADIWAKVIFGDIGRPDLLAQDLEENYSIALADLLNVRTFLDHNRIWTDTEPRGREGTSTGAYAFRGKRLTSSEVEENLKRHLEEWRPYVQRFGLLIIELHTIAPQLTASHLGRTAATAYDATHGYSDQYIVEVDVFHRIAEEAGLYPDMHHFSRFPDSELATVSINLLRGK